MIPLKLKHTLQSPEDRDHHHSLPIHWYCLQPQVNFLKGMSAKTAQQHPELSGTQNVIRFWSQATGESLDYFSNFSSRVDKNPASLKEFGSGPCAVG